MHNIARLLAAAVLAIAALSSMAWAQQSGTVNADRSGCEEFDGGPIIDCPGIVNRTHISDDDAFEVRTTLTLNIGLGSPQLYAGPIK